MLTSFSLIRAISPSPRPRISPTAGQERPKGLTSLGHFDQKKCQKDVSFGRCLFSKEVCRINFPLFIAFFVVVNDMLHTQKVQLARRWRWFLADFRRFFLLFASRAAHLPSICANLRPMTCSTSTWLLQVIAFFRGKRELIFAHLLSVQGGAWPIPVSSIMPALFSLDKNRPGIGLFYRPGIGLFAIAQNSHITRPSRKCASMQVCKYASMQVASSRWITHHTPRTTQLTMILANGANLVG